MTQEIQLGNSELVALINDEDLGLVVQHNWSLTGAGYASTWSPHRGGKPVRPYPHTILMHRLIIGAYWMPSGCVVDHANRNKLDNRRENLRIATVSQNNANSRPFTRHSKYKGVYPASFGDGWVAQIKANGQQQNLGVYHTEEDAARVYDAAARKAFNQFALCNFPHDSSKKLPIRTSASKSSAYRGVSWNTRLSKWKASITSCGERYHLGYYDIEEQAAHAYDEAAVRLHGARAKLNFPPD